MKKRNRNNKPCQEKSTRFSARASLIAIGQFFQQLNLFDIIEQKVQIAQKVVKHTPTEKLLDAFISILAGAKGLVEVNKRLRSDKMLQLAFGRTDCAEQSTISQTLNAATDSNVREMAESVEAIYQQHSHGYRHDYDQRLQLLDVDMSGMPAGKKAELASKGYFAKQPNKRGRQMGRVVATGYHEVVVSHLYDGKTQLNRALQPLVISAESVLGLDAEKRSRTLIRTDAGGGSDADINWLLGQDYRCMTKVYSGKRAYKLCTSVDTWHRDPKVYGREVGLISTPHPYLKPTTQIGVRSRKKNGLFSYHVLVTNLCVEDLKTVLYLPPIYQKLPQPIIWLAVEFYDLRGGGIETEFKGDKMGLGLTKRNKKRFTAQQLLVLLADLAHNLIIWAKTAMAHPSRRFAPYGIFRFVRDVFTISGKIVCAPAGKILGITLNKDDPLAADFQLAIQPLLDGITVNLGKI